MKYKVAQIPSVGMMVIEDENGILLSTAEIAGLLNSLEQRLAEAKARIAELEIKEFMYDEHSDAVRKCLTLNKQLVATEKALRWVCDVYVVDDYYSDDLRKEQLERAVRRVMVKVTGGEDVKK